MTALFQSYIGRSMSPAAPQAVAEATADVPAGVVPDVVFVFASVRQDPHIVARCLEERFPGVIVAGCTSVGEYVDGVRSEGALVVAALVTPTIRWSSKWVDFANFEPVSVVASLLYGAEVTVADPSRHFCLAFSDGLSRGEEAFAECMAAALGGVPMIGGSAADMRLTETLVFHRGAARRGGAVAVFAATTHGFTAVKHQAVHRSSDSFVVTAATPGERVIHELDGMPAAEVLAARLGRSPSALRGPNGMFPSMLLEVDGDGYVRAVQHAEPDGSLRFFCAVEEGLLLSLGEHGDLAGDLARDLPPLAGADLFVAFNCVGRAAVTRHAGTQGAVDAVLGRVARRMVGFDTFGEQFDGLHMNETLVGVVLYGESPAPVARTVLGRAGGPGRSVSAASCAEDGGDGASLSALSASERTIRVLKRRVQECGVAGRSDLSRQLGATRVREELARLGLAGAAARAAELEEKVASRTRELVAANADLSRAMAQLVEAEKMAALGGLVAGVAHELNTPLGNALTIATTLRGRVDELARSVADPAGMRRSALVAFVSDAQEATDLLVRSHERASRLIAQFKSVAADQTSERRGVFRVALAVADVVALFRPQLRRQNITLEIDGLPESLTIDSYPGPFEQVLANLIQNSLVHAFGERDRGSIHVQVVEHPTSLELTFSDDGAGMPERVARRAFEPFFTTRSGAGGTGLGLSITRNIVVNVLGGEIRIVAGLPGTRFLLHLPKIAPNAEVGS